MISITEAYVDSLAINASAMKNGRDLAKNNSFPMLGQSGDESIIFGEEKREARKNEPQSEIPPKRKKTNQAALLKKIAAQLEGIAYWTS